MPILRVAIATPLRRQFDYLPATNSEEKQLVPVLLPPDIKAFIADYNQARRNKDLLKMLDMISERFLYRGVTKQMAKQFLSNIMDYTAEAKLVVTRYKPDENGIELDVWMKDKYYQSPFMIETRLVKENGNWKWFGNQLQR